MQSLQAIHSNEEILVEYGELYWSDPEIPVALQQRAIDGYRYDVLKQCWQRSGHQEELLHWQWRPLPLQRKTPKKQYTQGSVKERIETIQTQLTTLGTSFPMDMTEAGDPLPRKRFHADMDKPEELLTELKQLYRRRQHRLEVDRDYNKKRQVSDSTAEHRRKKQQKKDEEEADKEQLARQALKAAPIWKRLGLNPRLQHHRQCPQ